jgi:hypothetical protein
VVTTVLTAALVAAVVAATSLWVLGDARSRAEAHRPVVARFGDVTIDKPEVWAVLCLVVVVLFLPLYLAARSAT